MVGFVTCLKLETELADTLQDAKSYTDSKVATAAPNLVNCSGAAIAAGTSVPTCAEMNAAISAGISGAAIGNATEAVAGKIEIATAAETGSATDPTRAIVPSNLANALNSTTTNAMQQAVVNAVEQAIGADAGAQTAIANAVKEEVASAIASDPTALATLMAALGDPFGL